MRRCTGLSADRFAADYWARQPLFTPGNSDGGFTDLLSPAAIDELLSRRGLRTPFIRMAKQGKVIPAAGFTRPGGTGAGIADQVADDRVLELLADGATLVLQGLHRNWPPLIEFAGSLTAELGHPVQINSYLTPPQNQGFSAHYDTHDVFVLQVSGTKRWLVHEPVLRDPLPSQTWEKYRQQVADRAAEQPLIEVTMRPGDALYLPRGYLHSATALGESSLHLTVGIHPVTRYALLKLLLAEAESQPSLRASLPMGTDLADPAALAGALRESADALVGYLDGAPSSGGATLAVARALDDQLAGSSRPAPIEPLRQLDLLSTVSPEQLVSLRPGLRVRVQPVGDDLLLHALDRQITFAATADPALKLLLSGEPVSAAQLPGLEPEEQLELVRRLLRAAVLVPAAGG